MLNFLSRIRWLPLMVTIALLILTYLQARQLVALPNSLGFWLSVTAMLLLPLSYASVRAWYVAPKTPKPRKFVTWVIGYEPPTQDPYITRAADFLQLRTFLEGSGAFALSTVKNPMYAEIRERWGELNLNERYGATVAPGDTVLTFHIILDPLDRMPTPDDLKVAGIIPLFHTLVKR